MTIKVWSPNISITWGSVRNAKSWIRSQTYWIRNYEGGTQNFNKLSRWFWCMLIFEDYCSRDCGIRIDLATCSHKVNGSVLPILTFWYILQVYYQILEKHIGTKILLTLCFKAESSWENEAWHQVQGHQILLETCVIPSLCMAWFWPLGQVS